jgi:hypothetical protein
VPCSAPHLSRVESGKRRLTLELASRLDQIYGTGNAVSALCAAETKNSDNQRAGTRPINDAIVIRLPDGGVTVLSRRDILAAFGIGALSAPLLSTLNRSLGAMRPTDESLAELRRTYDGFLVASRFSTTNELKDAIVGQIAIMDALRHRAPSREIARELRMLMARHAEAVSWLYEESFEVQRSLYWLDRATFWAQTVDWHDMVAYVFYRRSVLAMNYANDGLQVIELAEHTLRLPNVLPHVRGAALGKVSQGYAIIGDHDASMRAMDSAVESLGRSTGHYPNDPAADQHAVLTDNLVAMRRSAPLVLLGAAEAPIAILEPRLASIGEGNQRHYNVNRARVALAYANAGELEKAYRLSMETLAAIKKIPSLAVWRDLLRTSAILDRRWPNRSEVQDVRALVDARGPART